MSTAKKGKAKGNKAKGKVSKQADLPFHPLANIDPPMEGGDYAALVENIRTRGLREPIVLYKGKILDGRNRARACAEADIKPKYSDRKFSSNVEAKDYLDSANWHRRHLTPKQKNERIAARLKDNPTTSDRQIAKQTGASHPHVAKMRRKLEEKGDVETVTTSTDTKGRKQPRRRSKTATAKTRARREQPSEQSVDKSEPTHMDPELAAYVAADRAWKLGEPEPKMAPALQDGASAGEDARLRARIDELNTEVRRLEIKIAGLKVGRAGATTTVGRTGSRSD